MTAEPNVTMFWTSIIGGTAKTLVGADNGELEGPVLVYAVRRRTGRRRPAQILQNIGAALI